jgi:S1-C subfamily serine protease
MKRGHSYHDDEWLQFINSKQIPAEFAGLERGDIIIGLGDISVTGVDRLHRLLGEDVIGRDVPLTVLRDEQKVVLTVKPTAES